MATPKDIARVLKRLRFRVRDRNEDSEDWQSRDGRTDVTVVDTGQWTITWEEVREKGRGARELVQTLKGFVESKGIREAIRRVVEQEIDEMTGTAGVSGFGTPFAFSTKGPVSSKKKKKVNEGGDPYYAWRNDETATPRMKIGKVISEINKQLREMERVVRRSQRLQKEMGVPNSGLWKRTNNALMKIESRMHRITQKLRNMRG